jgi:hypothetical protein
MEHKILRAGEIWEAHLPYVVIRNNQRERYVTPNGRKTRRSNNVTSWYHVYVVKAIVVGLPTWNGFDPVGIMFPRYGCEKYDLPIIKNTIPTVLTQVNIPTKYDGLSITEGTNVFQNKIGKEKLRRNWYSDTDTFNKPGYDFSNPCRYVGSGYERWMPHTHIPKEFAPISTEIWDRYAVLYALMTSDPDRETKGIQYAE